jgi:hypothetical protein
MPSAFTEPTAPVYEDPLKPSFWRDSSSDERGYQRIRMRQDTAENWLKNDPVLASGEFGYVIGSTNPGELLKIGDGTVRWSQLPWVMANGNDGPPGPAGPQGPPGPPGNGSGGASISFGATPPAGPDTGDLWLKPLAAGTGELNVYDGTNWVQAGSGNAALALTIDTTKYNFGNPLYVIGGPPQTPNSLAARPDPNYPLQEYIDRVEAVINSKWFLWGMSPTLHELQVGGASQFFQEASFNKDAIFSDTLFVPPFNILRGNAPTNFEVYSPSPQFGSPTFKSNLTVNGNVSITGSLRYGGTLTQGPVRQINPNDPNSPRIEQSVYVDQFELPTPTENGYLRSDADDKNWYFAEPVIVSDSEPPAPSADMQAAGVLWIDPDGTPAEIEYSNANPPVSVDAPIAEMADGTPFGIVNNNYFEPDVVGGVPVVVNGKRYLLPLLEAPASADTRTPLFTFADEPVKQQSDGSWIGFDDTGMAYYQPFTVGGIPVMVGGKKYLLPLIEE